MRSIALLFLLMPFFALSQNLVPNPSFEEYSVCPNATGDFPLTYWQSWQESPDYFNVCNNSLTGWVGVPENTWGNQYPINGDGYTAIYTYAQVGDPNIREFIATQLSEPMIIGETYFIFFYASQIEGETGTYPMEYRCATNHIGLRFFKDPTYNNTDNILQPDNFTHLDYADVLADSDNWVKIEGWFTADDAYNWVAIGNFFDDAQTEIEIQNEFGNCFGVYFIENICVSADSSACDYLLNKQESALSNQINVFPNPTQSQINIESDRLRLMEVTIYNSIGEIVQHDELTVKKYNSDITNWPKGLYQVVVRDESSLIQTFKILKQ
jgi:hypothetical protein